VPRETTCPSCGNVLSVPDTVTKRWLTCPRCLASVGNPHVLLPAEGVTPGPAAAPPAPDEAVCPACGRRVEPGWRVCPNCEAPLGRSPVSVRRADADDEAVGDTKGVGLILVVLGLLGAVGVIFFLCGGGANRLTDAKHAAAVSFFVTFVLLGLVVAGMSISATGRQVAGRVLSMALGAAAVVLLTGVFILAAFVYSVASCFEGCDNKANRPGPAPPAPPKVQMKGP
jgi:Double zinc ribbon